MERKEEELMKKIMLMLVFVSMACVYQHYFCDERTNVCYLCDNVGCATVAQGTYDASITADSNTVTDASDTEAARPCFDNTYCATNSICLSGECHVPCTTEADCQRVDTELQYCNGVYCLAQ